MQRQENMAQMKEQIKAPEKKIELSDEEIANLSGKRNRLPGRPGSSQSPKEVGTKKKHTKTNHN